MSLLDLTVVEVLDVRPDAALPDGTGTWPCPVCGKRQPVGEAMSVLVRNRTAPFLERWVWICQPCLPAHTNGPLHTPRGVAEQG